MSSDKDETIIITTVGIDKEGDQYNLTALAVIPKGSEDINSNLEVFEAKGDTISQALDTISLDTGKKIGLAHCDCLILSQEILEDNITKILDFFIRTANLTTNATIVATDSQANKLIEATKSSNNLLDLSLKNIVSYQEHLLKSSTLNLVSKFLSRTPTKIRCFI
jgi:spore germination protein KC